MVEKLLIDPKCGEIWDIKLHCFYGEPAFIASIRDRGENLRHTYMTTDWQLSNIMDGQNTPAEVPEKPAELDEILRIGRILSAEFDYIRVDLYACDGQVYVGELTSFTLAGNRIYRPKSVDKFLFDEFKRQGKKHIADKRAAYHAMATDSLER